MKEKSLIAVLTGIWSALAFVGGLLLIRKYYSVGAASTYYSKQPVSTSIFWTAIAVAVAIVAIYGFVTLLVRAILIDGKERQILLYALPVFLVFAAGISIKLFTTSDLLDYYKYDERNIWDAAVTLKPSFFVYTSEIYLVSFFIFPVLFGPSLVKIVLNSLVLGYLVWQIKVQYSTKLAFVVYPMFLILKPVWEQGIKVHRMHWYAYIYLFWAVKLFFDSKQNIQKHSYIEILVMSLITAFLTVLRREGLYLFVFGIVLLILVYGREAGHFVKKRILIIFVLFAISEAILYAPAARNGFGEKAVTYRAWFVHVMSIDSLDRTVIADELEIIDQYMDLSMVDQYNEAYGLNGYSDCFYEWSDCQYYVMRTNQTITNAEFTNAVIAIIKKQPIAFIESRFVAFYAANSGFFNNLFIPLTLTIVLMIYALIKRDKVLFVLSLGVCCHTGITALTMPASYFKYFYEMYLYGYFMGAVMVTEIIMQKTNTVNMTASKLQLKENESAM